MMVTEVEGIPFRALPKIEAITQNVNTPNLSSFLYMGNLVSEVTLLSTQTDKTSAENTRRLRIAYTLNPFPHMLTKTDTPNKKPPVWVNPALAAPTFSPMLSFDIPSLT
jgi:hypothetical protein